MGSMKKYSVGKKIINRSDSIVTRGQHTVIRIGIDGHMLGDHSGGNESYYTNILKSMDVPRDYEIYLFVKDGTDISSYKDKFHIVYFKSRNALMRNFVELTLICLKYKLDILHTQYFIPFIRPCKVFCTIHDICFEHFKDIFTKKEYYRQRILIPYAARHSERIFTVSDYSKHDLVERYGINPDKVIITYNAVDEKYKVLADEELDMDVLKEKFSIGEFEYVLSVGNLQPRKNIVRLIKAFLSMKEKYGVKEKLVIVGKKAWMFDEILNAAPKDSDSVIFTDYVDEDNLVRLYNGAKCFIYPSFFEGFGIPPLEAMACGTPVAVADATSLPEVVGNAGIYFDPFDEDDISEKMYQLLTDESLREQLMISQKMQVRKFSWRESADIILRTYEAIGGGNTQT